MWPVFATEEGNFTLASYAHHGATCLDVFSSQLPMYTATSAVPTLPTPTFTAATTTGGDGWADPADTSMAAVPIAGCVYPDAWGPAAGSTAAVCGASTATAVTAAALITTA